MKTPAVNARAGEWRWWIVGLALLLRACMGIQRHSGQGKPPMYGDYEAQRHWMEITTNLPLSQWYVNSTTNDLMYWGIDYPPLSAYQSWIHGQMMAAVDPASLELGTSRGYETLSSKLALRWTVVLSDMLIFFPACLGIANLLASESGSTSRILVDLLVSPALILIDHGHFQYNCINLGLAIGATAMTLKGQFVLGAALFVAALNHKQMLLYYSPAFFAYMLGTCLQRQSVSRKLLLLSKIAATVVMSFALIWAPFMLSPTGAFAVVRRIFPSSRGLFEDYVANAWCVSSLIIKWRRLFSQQHLLVLCTLCTLATFLPAMLCTLLRPSRRAFLLALVNCSMAFFLFSYQVHEKSILLPLVALAMLGAVQLLEQAEDQRRDAVSSSRLVGIFCGGAVCIVTGFTFLPAPARYPFLEDAAMMAWSCMAFLAIFAYTNWLHFREYKMKATSSC